MTHNKKSINVNYYDSFLKLSWDIPFLKIMEWFSSGLGMNSRLLDMDYNALHDLALIFLSILISLLFVPSETFNLSHLDPTALGVLFT